MFLDLQTVLAQNVDSWAFSFLVKYMGLSPSLPSHCLEEMGLAHLWFLWRGEAKLGCLEVTSHKSPHIYI